MITKIIPEDFTVLVVDDDVYITEVVTLYLNSKGFHVLSASTGKEALERLKTEAVHIVVLDIMLPGMDGWEVCEAIRKKGDLPILMLSAKTSNEEKVRGLSLGADDYLAKPFDPNELIARIISLLRRSYTAKKKSIPMSIIQVGQLHIDTLARTVMLDNDYVDLTPREYALLLVFIEHPNQVFSRQQLLDLVWGDDYFGEDRVVDVFVTRLRQKLPSAPKEIWEIETVRGIGYKFMVGSPE